MCCRVQCGRCLGRHRDASVDSLATFSKTDCQLRSLYASRASPSLPSSNTSCLHHHHQIQQQVLAHHCTASPHHDQLTHCQPTALCLHSRRLCGHGNGSVCRCIYSSTTGDDEEEDSDTPRRRRRARPLLAADTDTQTDGETDDHRPRDNATHRHSSPDFPLATRRLLMTSSEQLPVASDDVIAVCRAAELIMT